MISKTKTSPFTMTVVYPINIRFPMERANSVQIAHTCRELAQQGVRVYLLVRRTTKISDAEILSHYGLTPHKNLHIIRVRVINWDDHAFVWNKSFYLSVLLYILWFLCTRKIDWFLMRDLGLAQVLLPWRKIFGFKILYETHLVSYIMAQRQHELLPNTAPVPQKLLQRIERKERYVMANSDKIVVITERLKNCVQELFNVSTDRIAVLPDGVDLSQYNSSDAQERRGLVYIGQLYPWKGVDTLIEAMQYIEDKLTVVGGIPFEEDLERLRAKAKDLGVIDKIRFVGFVPHSEVARYLTSAKISVIPLPDNVMAREYTSPLKLFESMGAGTAVVASDLESIREIIKNGSNGMLFTPENPVDLARAVNTVLMDNKILDTITKQALSDAKTYSWQERTSRMILLCSGNV